MSDREQELTAEQWRAMYWEKHDECYQLDLKMSEELRSLREQNATLRAEVCIATEEHRRKAEHQAAVQELRATKWEERSLATLGQVLYLLNEQKRGEA